MVVWPGGQGALLLRSFRAIAAGVHPFGMEANEENAGLVQFENSQNKPAVRTCPMLCGTHECLTLKCPCNQFPFASSRLHICATTRLLCYTCDLADCGVLSGGAGRLCVC